MVGKGREAVNSRAVTETDDQIGAHDSEVQSTHVRADVLVLEVVGVLPDVNADEGNVGWTED